MKAAKLHHFEVRLSSVNTYEHTLPLLTEVTLQQTVIWFMHGFYFVSVDNIWVWMREVWLVFIMECEFIYKIWNMFLFKTGI
jgi:hypothetical protein